MGVKRNLAKSLIYRVITIMLGFLTSFIITGDISFAINIALITESVQFVYYFGFETVWSYYDEKRLRELIRKEFRDREIDVKLTMGALIDMAKEFSQIDTFIPEVYSSISSFFNKMLENKQLKNLHDEISKYKSSFETTHKGRGFSSDGSYRTNPDESG